MVLFLFSLIGMPLTAGFAGKLLLFWSAMGVSSGADVMRQLPADEVARLAKQAELFRMLAVLGVINSAIGGWFYLRIAAVMFLRDPLEPIGKSRAWPVLVTVWVCAVLTLGFGLWQQPLLRHRPTGRPPRQNCGLRSKRCPAISWRAIARSVRESVRA